MTKIYQEKLNDFKGLAVDWQSFWDSKVEQIEDAFSKAYEVDVKPILNDMKAYVNLNPVCPRYLDSKSFYLFYDLPKDRMLRTCLHEIMHFLWFYKWQEFFHDDVKEYDTPHLKWIFSEMVQETMMKNTPIKNLSEWQGNAYVYFYTMKIGNCCILDTLNEIHQKAGIMGLFTDGYRYCQEHENEIRQAICQAETL